VAPAPGRSVAPVAKLVPLLVALAVLPAPAADGTMPVISRRCPTNLLKSCPANLYILALADARAPDCAPLDGAPAEVDPPTLPEIFPDVPVAPPGAADAVINMNSPFAARSMHPVSVTCFACAALRVDVVAGSGVRAPGAPAPCAPLCTGDCVGVCGVAWLAPTTVVSDNTAAQQLPIRILLICSSGS
jgi:hypothetical protein